RGSPGGQSTGATGRFRTHDRSSRRAWMPAGWRAGGRHATDGEERGMSEQFRVEHDSMGEIRVPASAKWAAQTQRAVENFPISGLTVDPTLIAALATLKGAAAMVNAKLKTVDKETAEAIGESAAEIAKGVWDAEFPIDV